MAKKKRKKITKKGINKVVFILLSLIVVLLPIVLYLATEAYNKKTQIAKVDIQKQDDVMQKMKDLLEKEKHITDILDLKEKKVEKNSTKEQTNYYLSEIKDYATSLAQIEYEDEDEEKEIQKGYDTNDPKLMIIIDDISFAYQVKEIKDIDLKLVMSYLPPTKRHPNSANIAQNDKNAMLHLPLEAMRYNTPESKTLKTTMSKEEMDDIISIYRKLYPNVKYTNNHTGSKFTSDLESMKRLFEVLRKHGFIFIDSKTTRDSKAKIASKGLQDRVLQRDIFLDNKPDVKYIHNQLRSAVKIAKRVGFAIAIGHPHKETIKALKSAKHILNGVKLIYPDEL